MNKLFAIASIVLLSQVNGEEPRMFGGQNATKKQFPFYVQVLVPLISNQTIDLTPRVHGCDGSLIHPKWILTSAHCFQRLDLVITKETFVRNMIMARMGSVKVKDLKDKDSVLRYIRQAYPHPEYIRVSSDDITPILVENDISVAELKTPFALNDRIAVIHLADSTTPLCKKGIVIGAGFSEIRMSEEPTQGQTEEDAHVKLIFPEILKFAEVQTLKEVIRPPVPRTNTTFYSKAEFDKGHPYIGDLGGPFICQNGSKSGAVQHGVTSDSVVSDAAKGTVITIYESIDKHLEFIMHHVFGNQIMAQQYSTAVSEKLSFTLLGIIVAVRCTLLYFIK